ncbi:MAG: type 1 glutamine amidotransferase domain-containing protein [Stackebrandtia sp.]
MTRTNRILMVLTSTAAQGEGGDPTGFYLPEAAHPWKVFRDAGYEIDFVSPLGGKPPMDGADMSDQVQRAFLDDVTVAGKLKATLRPDEIDASAFDAIFYVGGHGAMWDFPHDKGLAAIAAAIYESDGVVAAVCHGPAGLVNVTLSDGAYLVGGKNVAAFTNDEEDAVGKTEIVPFLLQTTLEQRGAVHTGADNFAAHVVADGRLVTGQNPASSTGVAEGVVKALAETRR